MRKVAIKNKICRVGFADDSGLTRRLSHRYDAPAMNHPDHEQQASDPNRTGAKTATGCGLGCLVMILIAGGVVFLITRSIQNKADEFAEAASSDPVAFQYPSVQAAEAEQVIQRFDTFRQAIANSMPAETLILNKDELNILISQHPTFEPLAGRVHLDIVDDKIEADLSFKPEDLPVKIPFVSKAFAGKYLNGAATVDISIENEEARLYLLDFKVSGMEVPEELKTLVKEENFMKGILDDAEIKAFLERIETLKVEGNALRVIPEQTGEPEA